MLRLCIVYTLENSRLISGNFRLICLAMASLVRLAFSLGGRSSTSCTKVFASYRKILLLTFSRL
jgi:hypothetical protein